MRPALVAIFLVVLGACAKTPPPNVVAPETELISTAPNDDAGIASSAPIFAEDSNDDRVDAPTPLPPMGSEPEPNPDDDRHREPTAAENKACAARGGNMEHVCMTRALMCVVHYRDAGKRCTSKSQCGGECLWNGKSEKHPAGTCAKNNDPCGCKAPITNGHLDHPGCRD
ncbi:MAG: hypothetical protein ABI183_19410 [Polyangiaceae bacterium]